MKDNVNEMLPLVDGQGNVVGQATRGMCHDGVDRPLHPVVHLPVFDSQGRLYLQKRPAMKDIQRGSGTLPWAVMSTSARASARRCAARCAKSWG